MNFNVGVSLATIQSLLVFDRFRSFTCLSGIGKGHFNLNTDLVSKISAAMVDTSKSGVYIFDTPLVHDKIKCSAYLTQRMFFSTSLA